MTKIIGLVFLAVLVFSIINDAITFNSIGAGVFGLAFIVIPSGRKK